MMNPFEISFDVGFSRSSKMLLRHTTKKQPLFLWYSFVLLAVRDQFAVGGQITVFAGKLGIWPCRMKFDWLQLQN
jgi:hypothetical protein